MVRESVAFGLTVVAVVVGLAILLVGEAMGVGEIAIVVGGIAVLLGVGGLTGLVAAADG